VTTTVWLDDQRIWFAGQPDRAALYDFGTGVTPGKHRLTICVDNTVKIDLGRFVSALFGGTWGNMNGISAASNSPPRRRVWIEEVQVYSRRGKKLARVAVKIGNATSRRSWQVDCRKAKRDATWDENSGRAEMNVDMSGAKLWDEFSPNLSEVTVKLGDDERTVHFGMRKFAARGTQFTMNDRRCFCAGHWKCSIFPLTGYPPTDVASWRRIFRSKNPVRAEFHPVSFMVSAGSGVRGGGHEGIIVKPKARWPRQCRIGLERDKFHRGGIPAHGGTPNGNHRRSA